LLGPVVTNYIFLLVFKPVQFLFDRVPRLKQQPILLFDARVSHFLLLLFFLLPLLLYPVPWLAR
jgi:hypothetical protein